MKFVISLVNLVYVAMSRNRTQYVPTMVKSSLYLLLFFAFVPPETEIHGHWFGESQKRCVGMLRKIDLLTQLIYFV